MVDANFQESPITFTSQALQTVFGIKGSGREQMIWSLILAILAYILTVFSLGATVLLVALFTVTFLIGLFRFIIAAVRG